MANFDAISYSKGQAVLKQLGAYAGDDAFLEGLRAYFRDHAWGNTTLQDLTGAIGTASGHDLAAWETAWLDRAGTDTLVLSGDTLTVVGPDGESPRPHRLDIGCYADTAAVFQHVADVPVLTSGPTTKVELPDCDLRLVNDHDLTFAAARTDQQSLDLILHRAGELPDVVSRALAVTTAFDMLVKGELGADDDADLRPGRARDRTPGRRGRAVPPAGRAGRGSAGTRRSTGSTPSGAGSPTRPPYWPRSRSSPRAPCSSWRTTRSPPSTSPRSTRPPPTTSAWPGAWRPPALRGGSTTRTRSSGCSSATPTRTPRSTP